MSQTALSDVKPPVVEQAEGLLPAMDDAASLRSLHEKLETAFALTEGPPPVTYTSPFDSGTQRQAAAIVDLDGRLGRLETSPELAHLRETMREICSVISGLAMEAERGANERDDKIASLADALNGQLRSDRERLDAVELRVVNSEVANARGFDEARAVLRQLEERMQVADGHNEDLAYNMRMLRSDVLNLNEAAVALRKLEERVEAGDLRHDDLVRRTGNLKDDLRAVGETAAASVKQLSETATASLKELEDRLKAADVRHDDLTHGMNRMKGDVLSETALALREHRSQMEQAEKAISELKDRNARSVDRIEALTDSLGSVSRKLDGGTERLATLYSDIGKLNTKLESGVGELTRKFDVEVAGAQLLAERLGTVEKWIARSLERERAQAELHARLANSLLSPSQD